MITRLIDFSLDNRVLVVIGWLIVVGLGVRALGRLPIDAVPDVTNVQVQVLTNSPGLAPEEVERLITFPVETAMSGLPKVEEIRSVSKFGLSVVTVVFEEGSDIYWARQLVGERLVAAREQIPPGYGEPEMGPISTGLGEIYQFEVRGEPMCPAGGPDTPGCYTPMELRTILDWYVNYQLRSVPGIVEVNSFGGELKTYQVTIHPDRLVAYGLTTGDVLAALERNNRNVGGGYIVHADEQYLVRGEGLIEELNGSEEVDGILLQLPLPGGLDAGSALARIDPARDVDGLHVSNMGLLLAGLPGLRPCTPSGCMVLLEEAGCEFLGKKAVVVGRSNLVGKPVALMLLAKNATVTLCHSRTRDLRAEVEQADIVIAAVGRPELIKGEWIKEGAYVIDVGVNRLEDGSLVGDVEFEVARRRAAAITPVPGGVGPMTITQLLFNTVQAARERRG